MNQYLRQVRVITDNRELVTIKRGQIIDFFPQFKLSGVALVYDKLDYGGGDNFELYLLTRGRDNLRSKVFDFRVLAKDLVATSFGLIEINKRRIEYGVYKANSRKYRQADMKLRDVGLFAE